MDYPLLDIRDLSVIFGSGANKSVALHSINLTINRGEIVGVVGESGSGKTVTSLSILKLLPANTNQLTSGEILFSRDGKEIVDLIQLADSEIKKIRGRDISMIFQEPMTSLNPVMTCGRQVIEAIRIHQKISDKEAKEHSIALFKKVKLPDPENIGKKYPHELSGGQKQRVMIAMAMSCKPVLLIADEPTTALDVTVQKNILKLIKELQKDHEMSVFFITHDLNLVAEIADRVIVMLKGSIVEEGSVDVIFKKPQHPYTKALLACRPKEHNKGKRLPVVSDFMSGHYEPEHSSNNNEKAEIKNYEKVLVEVKNLVVSFPLKKNLLGKITKEFTAVNDVSFSIFKGETLGVVGESGCGKTTLGRSLIRLIEPTSGKILFNGSDIAEMQENNLRKHRKEIQIIFQDPFGSLNPRLTIGSALEEPIKVHHLAATKDERREKVLDLLQKVDLKPEHFNRYPHQFSGGQRQRICIARALAINPEFIICDESVSALDVSVQAQVLNLLNDLKKELSFTCVFISHDLGVVRYISDRIMVMQQGKIIEIGKADDIYFSPKKLYTQELIESIPKGIAI